MNRSTLIATGLMLAGLVTPGLSGCSPADASNTAEKTTAAADAVDAAKTTASEVVETAAAAVTETVAPADTTLTLDEARARARSKDRLARVDGEPDPATRRRSAADPALVTAGEKQFVAGKDYDILKPSKRTSSPAGKVEVAEVFMYQCPHCFSFEPFIESLLKTQPEEMNFVRLPAVFNQDAKLHAQAFYAAQSMGIGDKLHTPMFQEIHTRRNYLRSEDAVLDFVEKQGINRDDFRKAMKSFEVDSKVRDAMDLNMAYQVERVPTLVINGKYVTSGSHAGSTQKLRDIVNYLVAKEAVAL